MLQIMMLCMLQNVRVLKSKTHLTIVRNDHVISDINYQLNDHDIPNINWLIED